MGFRRGVQAESKREKNYAGEKQRNAATYGPFKTTVCAHADNLALGNTDPPEQQAGATTFRPREVVGALMEVVARPALTPRH